jgi:hypothetical protein
VLIRQTKTVLASMLDDAGLNSSAAATNKVRPVVETFRRFAALPVEDARPSEEDGDRVLDQSETYDPRSARILGQPHPTARRGW